jgi:hypothetical protein
MLTTPFETTILGVIASCRGLLPDEQLDSMSDLVRAGERGIALENLATQLYEYDVAVPSPIVDEIAALGTKMRLNPKLWNILKRG